MNILKPKNILKEAFFSFLLFSFLLTSYSAISQNMLPWRGDIVNRKIASVVASVSIVQNEKSKKKYVDTIKYDYYGNLAEKRITAYDTDSKRVMEGDWKYTYDSLGNRKLETRKSSEADIMNYFNYVYDSNRIKKEIWVYWTNMKLIFSRIYEVKYDGLGRLYTEKIEDGSEKLDTIFGFKYDTLNRLDKIICSGDKDFKDTINVVSYIYNPDGSTSKVITKDKMSKTVEEYTYDQNRKVLKKESEKGSTTYQYDKTGLLIQSEVIDKEKKGQKLRYTYSYLYHN